MHVERDGVTLYYEIVGDGPETVVLTHGLGSSGITWRALVDALAKRYRVVTWDLRAHGRSSAVEVPCSVAELGADLAAVVAAATASEAIDEAPVHALGHSAGGVVTMQLALARPERVRSAILVGTSSECNARAAAYYESLATTAEREGGAAVVRRLGGDPTGPLPDGRGFASVARAMGSLHPMPLTPMLDRVRCPTLVVVGADDALGVGGSVIISRRVPRCRLEIVAGRGHGIFHEDSEGFAGLVREFLADPRVGG